MIPKWISANAVTRASSFLGSIWPSVFRSRASCPRSSYGATSNPTTYIPSPIQNDNSVMEFNRNFRSTRDGSSAYFSPHFTDQPIEARYTETEIWRPDLHSPGSLNDTPELIHRELEKERIRAEIIAEEIGRLIVENEVRSESVFEREMATIRRREMISRFRSDSRVGVLPLLPGSENNNSNRNRLVDEVLVFTPDREIRWRKGFEALPFQQLPSARIMEPHSTVTPYDIEPPRLHHRPSDCR